MSPVFLKARHLWSPWPAMHPSYTRDFKDAVEISILLKGKKGIVLRGSFPTPQAGIPPHTNLAEAEQLQEATPASSFQLCVLCGTELWLNGCWTNTVSQTRGKWQCETKIS